MKRATAIRLIVYPALILLVPFIILIGGGLYNKASRPWGVIHALPDTATEVQYEYPWLFGGDYVLYVKARLPEEDFHAFAEALELSRFKAPSRTEEDARDSDELNVRAYGGPEWWDPPPSGVAPRYSASKDYGTEYVRLEWHDGYVYYQAGSY